jgi:hypothetical protein
VQRCSLLPEKLLQSAIERLVCVFNTCCFVTYQVLCCGDKEIVDVVIYRCNFRITATGGSGDRYYTGSLYLTHNV